MFINTFHAKKTQNPQEESLIDKENKVFSYLERKNTQIKPPWCILSMYQP